VNAASARAGYRVVEPLSGAAPYIGGKRNLAARIIDEIDKVAHLCYAEPFVGMGGVFFRRRDAPPLEVVNDRSRDVANFFRVLQRHYQAFIDMMKWQITTRSEFARLVASNVDTLTDLERAARFYYLQKTGFGGKVAGRSFGVQTTQPGRFDITRLIPHLEELHERLAAVVIENLPYDEFLTRYDRPTTLFYLDPPYYGSENDYGRGMFEKSDFENLGALLKGIQGRFIMTVNDVKTMRECFAGFTAKRVDTTYTVAGGRHAKRYHELLVTGGAKTVK
jgi:DNA adenine methylase